MNNARGYAATVLFREINGAPEYRNEQLESFEEELCELKASGYSVEGSGMDQRIVYAILTKKVDSSVQSNKLEEKQ